jgi:hypothetical protein
MPSISARQSARVVVLWARFIAAMIAAVLAGMSSSFPEPLPIDAGTRTSFNIRSQPLADALLAYGAETGLEVFYDAALAEERRSNEVVGVFTRQAALQVLLRGTGYSARPIGNDTFMIAPAPPGAMADAAKLRQNLQPYFAAVQGRIDDILCRQRANAALAEVHLQFWLSPSGLVTKAEVIGDDGDLARDQSRAESIHGLVFAPPPAAMPQPVNMVIYPPSKYSKPCNASDAKRGAE